MQTHLYKNIFIIEADTQKELVLTFFRMQEFYESQKPELYNKKFSVFDFIDTMMNDNGEINYFSHWDGFNIPDFAFEKWKKKNKSLTPYEKNLIDLMEYKINYAERYYIIGYMKGDKNCLNHEISHALYYVDKSYREKVDILNSEIESKHPEFFDFVMQDLAHMGYNESVIKDEANAWLSTTSKQELLNSFSFLDIDISYTKCLPMIKKYRKLLSEYNTFA